MSDEINFLDLCALEKIGADAVVEKFGGLINSSFFEASNILGTLKIKGLIDFTTAFPGQSKIEVTELGRQVMKDADLKVDSQFDQLDMSILLNLSTGKRALVDLTNSLNLRSSDLAMRLYKLEKTDFIKSILANANVEMTLTEKGFLRVKDGMPKTDNNKTQDIKGETSSQLEEEEYLPQEEELNYKNEPNQSVEQKQTENIIAENMDTMKTDPMQVNEEPTLSSENKDTQQIITNETPIAPIINKSNNKIPLLIGIVILILIILGLSAYILHII